MYIYSDGPGPPFHQVTALGLYTNVITLNILYYIMYKHGIKYVYNAYNIFYML